MNGSYRLLDSRGQTVRSDVPGLLGGNRRLRIYGRLDCPSARRALPRGYARRRVFFADEATAIAAGYRPCAVCMPTEYRAWKTSATVRRSAAIVARVLLAALAVAVCVARPAHAQSVRSARIEGTVTDSVHARPLAGVRVVAVSTGSRTDVRADGTTDSAGRYHLDSLPAGRYVVGFESPLLDSLEIVLPPRETIVAPLSAATVDLALPPAAKLRAALCGDSALAEGTGVLYGHVVHAETENALTGGEVALQWRDLTFDRAKLRTVSAERAASVPIDEGGWYRACGIPTGTWVSMQVQVEGRVGPVLRTRVDDTLGVAIRHLSYATSTARSIADASKASDRNALTAPLTGRARVTGVVRGAGDLPLASAEVTVRGSVARARSDSSGRFSLAGLPAGTQMLEVRRVGYGAAEQPVNLRADTTVTADVRLQRVVNLDSMRVVAIQSRYTEFEDHRRTNLFGRFLGEKEMAWQRRMPYASDIAEKFPMFRVYGEGPKAVVIDPTFYPPCKVNVVVDGMEQQEINDTPPIIIGAMELYRTGVPMPVEIINNRCGAIVIWTKRGR